MKYEICKKTGEVWTRIAMADTWNWAYEICESLKIHTDREFSVFISGVKVEGIEELMEKKEKKKDKPMKRYFCWRSCLVWKCMGPEAETLRDVIKARTKKEAKEKFRKQNHNSPAQVCVEITESEEELPYADALKKYDRY